MWQIIGTVIIFWSCLAFSAELPSNTDVVSKADDAFGIILGPENLGLYSPNSVRGFSPLTAGNVRLNGLYFDQQGLMPDRLTTETRIRVGLSAVDFPWPAPTGIVDNTLRKPDDTPKMTSVAYFGPNSTLGLELNGSEKFRDGDFGIAAGAAYHNEEDLPGQLAHMTSFAVLPQWTPSKDLSISTFWARESITDSKPWPTLYLSEDQSPPHFPVKYFGQDWTGGDTYADDYGVLGYAKLGGSWVVRAGLFRSVSYSPRSYVDLYENTSSAGLGDHSIFVFPGQQSKSTSEEIQLSQILVRHGWRQKIDIGLRGRDLHARYGGADELDFGVAQAGIIQALPPPVFHFGPTTTDRISEYSAEASYSLRWNNLIDFTAGLRRPTYSRHIDDPVLGMSSTSINPSLYNSSITVLPTNSLSIFGALTRGLEDSGVAPANADNRGEILGAVRSSEVEVGLKYALSASLTFLAGAFDVQKPYFALNTENIFEALGLERHRGAEFSLTGTLTPGLHVVIGALLTTPEVLTRSTPQQVIGSRPVGQSTRAAQVSADYTIPWIPNLSVDGSITATNGRPASVDNALEIPGYATITLGARYRMDLDNHATTIRIDVANVGNTYSWYVGNDGGLTPIPPRRIWAYITVDL